MTIRRCVAALQARPVQKTQKTLVSSRVGTRGETTERTGRREEETLPEASASPSKGRVKRPRKSCTVFVTAA